MSLANVPGWWRQAVIYQIYPRSFADANGDGIGDLPGISGRLDYIADTGFDTIWLSPFYRSPMADFGYDISDYTDVDPIFGNLDDLDVLIDRAHGRGIRVIVDWVPSHTSKEHAWFVDSRSSRTSAHRDWYVWRDGRPDGGPPNNWQSQFPAVGSGWSFDERTEQWYLHSYLPEQPDLDWGNPEVVEAMSNVLRFWLRRGVDGFRIDVPQRLAKHPDLLDNPGIANEPDRRFVGRRFDEDQPAVFERLRQVRRVVDEFPDRLLVGEVYVLDQRRMASYVNDGDGLHLAHNFTFLRLPWEAQAFRDTLLELEGCLAPGAWPAWCLGNHDHGRIASRFDYDGHGDARARLVSMLLLTLRGTPFFYQGDELGLPDSVVAQDQIVDVHDRDRARGPMPWGAPSRVGAAAGFSSGTPWLPLATAAETLNAATQRMEPHSHLTLVRELLQLRRRFVALHDGAMNVLDGPPEVLAFSRQAGSGQSWLIALNFEDKPIRMELASIGSVGWSARDVDLRLAISTDPTRSRGAVVGGSIELASLEGVVLTNDALESPR